jgi:hypothetical protein
MSTVSTTPQPLLTVAASHGWSGDESDIHGLANALERAQKELPSIAELVDALHFVQNAELVVLTINSLRLSALTDPYNPLGDEDVDADVPYVGKIIKHDLLNEKENDPNPYDKWFVTLLLENGKDTIKMVADNLEIGKQATATFEPDAYLDKKVLVVLGDEVWTDSCERYIKSIELL